MGFFEKGENKEEKKERLFGSSALRRGEVCLCASCGREIVKKGNVPCYRRKCPRCDSPMIKRR